jgi:hypothetical protein
MVMPACLPVEVLMGNYGAAEESAAQIAVAHSSEQGGGKTGEVRMGRLPG